MATDFFFDGADYVSDNEFWPVCVYLPEPEQRGPTRVQPAREAHSAVAEELLMDNPWLIRFAKNTRHDRASSRQARPRKRARPASDDEMDVEEETFHSRIRLIVILPGCKAVPKTLVSFPSARNSVTTTRSPGNASSKKKKTKKRKKKRGFHAARRSLSGWQSLLRREIVSKIQRGPWSPSKSL